MNWVIIISFTGGKVVSDAVSGLGARFSNVGDLGGRFSDLGLSDSSEGLNLSKF